MAAAARLSEMRAQERVDEATRRVAELEVALAARDLQLSAMGSQVRASAGEADRLRRQLEHQKTVTRQAQAKARKNRGGPTGERETHGFLDAVDQLRWDIRQTWVESTRPEDKERWPLQEYAVGPGFCESVQKVEGVSRERVLVVACLLLTGRGVRGDHENRRNWADPVL